MGREEAVGVVSQGGSSQGSRLRGRDLQRAHGLELKKFLGQLVPHGPDEILDARASVRGLQAEFAQVGGVALRYLAGRERKGLELDRASRRRARARPLPKLTLNTDFEVS